MVILLVHRLGRSLKFPSRLENRNPKSEALSASLNGFRSKLSSFSSQILSSPVEGSEYLSMAWIRKSFRVLDVINKEFARLAVEIDYPMTEWGAVATDQYLKYSLEFLDMLNSVSSSVSHLSQAKVSLIYALSLVENSPSPAKEILLQIPPKCRIKIGGEIKMESSSGIEEKSVSEKDFVILEAVSAMKSLEFWVLEMVRKSAGDLKCPNANSLNSRLGKEMNEKPGAMEEVNDAAMQKPGAMEEVTEVNDAAMHLAAEISTEQQTEAAEKLKRRLDVLENSLQEIDKETKSLFSRVLATRNQLLENFRFFKRLEA